MNTLVMSLVLGIQSELKMATNGTDALDNLNFSKRFSLKPNHVVGLHV